MRLIYPILLVILLAALGGCASYADEALASDGTINNDRAASAGFQGEEYLYAHDIAAANAEYKRALDASPRSGGAAAGYGITSLLLLPYSAAATTLITGHLGARDALDAQGDVIYGDQGLIYFIARGVAWEDGPSTAGIKTLLVDRLPWTRNQIDTVDGFVRGLDNPATLMSDDLVTLARELNRVAADLGIATGDEGFTSYFVPGAVFHDESLDLNLGKAEVSLLRGALSAAEAAIYFIAAYDHGWSLERAFGESIWQPLIDDPMDPDHVVGAEAVDYQVAYLNETLGRAIATGGHLEKAAVASKSALEAFASALDFGIEETRETTLNWRAADSVSAAQFAEFLRALAEAVEGPTELPYTEPAQTADFSPLFAGRTVASDEALLVVTRVDDGFGEAPIIEFDADVLTHLLDGIFDPSFESDPAPVLLISDDVERLVDNVSSAAADDFERSVGGAF